MIYLIFVVFLIAAAIFDLLTLTIPNWLCALLAASFFPSATIAHFPQDALFAHFACGLTVLAGAFLLFLCGGLGGGDAKLAAGIALWVGWDGLPVFLFQTALWGGALAVFLLLMRALPLPLIFVNHRFITKLIDPAAGAPYGVALAIGGIFAIPHAVFWRLTGAA